jgi:hypothetical protein
MDKRESNRIVLLISILAISIVMFSRLSTIWEHHDCYIDVIYFINHSFLQISIIIMLLFTKKITINNKIKIAIYVLIFINIVFLLTYLIRIIKLM